MFDAVLLFREALYGALVIARRVLGARRVRGASAYRLRRRGAGRSCRRRELRSRFCSAARA